jgi:hypothetical protein
VSETSSKRGIEEIRAEISAERDGLVDDLDALKAEVRSLVPFAVACVAVIALVTFRKGAMSGARTMWRLM